MKLIHLPLVIILFINIKTSIAEESGVNFNSDFLIYSDGSNASSIDLSYLNQADGIQPEIILLVSLLMGKITDRKTLLFIKVK